MADAAQHVTDVTNRRLFVMPWRRRRLKPMDEIEYEESGGIDTAVEVEILVARMQGTRFWGADQARSVLASPSDRIDSPSIVDLSQKLASGSDRFVVVRGRHSTTSTVAIIPLSSCPSMWQ